MASAGNKKTASQLSTARTAEAGRWKNRDAVY
jgi:hypothetical protein